MSALIEHSQEWLEKSLIQGTPEWLELRRKKIGSSDTPKIMGFSSPSQRILWEQKVGVREETKSNPFMERGKILEEPARQEFIEKKSVEVKPHVILHPTLPWMIASLDGINMEKKVIVEIKNTINLKQHEEVKAGKIPKSHFAQVQHQIACSGYDGSYYMSCLNEYDKTLQCFRIVETQIIEVPLDIFFIEEMIEMDYAFWKCVENFTPPTKISNRKSHDPG